MTKYCLIGSSRYKRETELVAKELRELGHEVVIFPTRVPHTNNHITPEDLEEKKIVYRKFHDGLDRSEVCLVCNFQDYIGLNSAIDIGYAIKAGKTIEVMNPTKIPELLMLGAEKAD